MRTQKKLEIKRYNPDYEIGLTTAQVEERRKQKLINKTNQTSGKSYFQIFFQNIFTFFNLIWAVVFFALCAAGAYTDLFFMIVIVLNTTIAIVQEIKAKRTVEKLSYVSAPKLTVIRNGKFEKTPASRLCLDDVVELATGNQIPTDCILLVGKVEVNESILTGESESVIKTVGDVLLAGSFITSGACRARVDKIGKESYIQSVAKQAKKFKNPKSNLFKDINTLVKYIGIIIVPIGLLMLLNNYFAYGKDLAKAVTKVCGSITGMVPSGMFLLITISLSLGVIKLGKKRTLVQDLYSIEMLARTNVLCLDKTGTITDGTMRVCEHHNIKSLNVISNEKIIANLLACQSSTNQTSSALLMYYKKSTDLVMTHNIEFSSKRKFSATCFENLGTFAIGAPEFLHTGTLSDEINDLINKYTNDGKRVLMLAHSPEITHTDEIPYYMEPLAIIAIEDHIREDAIETINWFKQNGVGVKIISGDNPYTVSVIAKRVGVENADSCISLEGMSLTEVAKIANQFTVFGRVSPEQKHALVKALKREGNVVAMTGDGVNDSLALKEADCSIAMADGSEVARNLSNIVLLDNKFSALPSVIFEGRQVVNNVQKSSTLFLMKTVFTILLSLVTLIIMSPYPFSPSQLILFELFITGLPSVILAIQPNTDIIKGDFLSEVLKRALPNGLLLLLNILIVIAINKLGWLSAEEFTTLSTLTLIGTGMVNLIYLCLPFNLIRIICVGLSATAVTIGAILLGWWLGVTTVTLKVILILVALVGIAIPIHIYIPRLSDKLFEKFKVLKPKIFKQIDKPKKKKKKVKRSEFVISDIDDDDEE